MIWRWGTGYLHNSKANQYNYLTTFIHAKFYHPLPHRMSRCNRNTLIGVRIFGIFMLVIAILFSIYAIISIGENSSSSSNMSLLSNFGKSLAQDWLFTPLLMIVLMFIVRDENITRIMVRNTFQLSGVYTEKKKNTKVI